MPRAFHGKTPLTEDALLTKAIQKLDLGPFTHASEPDEDAKCFRDLYNAVKASIKPFHEWRRLAISWLLAVLVGVFGNLFASALFGRVEYSNWVLALVLLCATSVAAALFLWLFPLNFQHTFLIVFDKQAADAIAKIGRFSTFKQENNLDNFLRVYHLLLVRDCVRQLHLRMIKIIDVMNAMQEFETWITVELQGRAVWIRRNVERDLKEELLTLCEGFAMTTSPLLSIDDSTPSEQVRAFRFALGRIGFDRTMDKIRWDILQY